MGAAQRINIMQARAAIRAMACDLPCLLLPIGGQAR
jgi:hypothetical protein